MSFWKYLLANRLWILLAFYAVSAFFIWYWNRFQGGDEQSTKLTIGLNAILTMIFVGGNYYKWKQSRL